MFKTGLTSIHQLKERQTVTGAVRNSTSFGCFVDIGVDKAGLIHRSNIPRDVELGPGDKVECIVKNIDIERLRIGLIYRKKISRDICLC